ncbi:hypothetical protein SS50377_21838 [Spironucleus salmonicida]|uniref:Myb-like domain-containing protein n=1 Tax=Spironucleus salmonicida TaxID=348837 RepID=V6LIL2_9EUKA|nr:hypothetical protein SS50377_21838 [Spironucleus salmonicida]|eukprot:EST44382.1 Hypothetical protein SS50377_15685 [Spironucleus salmonicida]
MKDYEVWSYNEKLQFQELSEKYTYQGKLNFKEIAAVLKSKTARQCYDFYTTHKNRSEPRHLWCANEEHLLLQQAQIRNRDWDKISKEFFPGFSRSQLRNKYNHLVWKRNQEMQDISSIILAINHIISK